MNSFSPICGVCFAYVLPSIQDNRVRQTSVSGSVQNNKGSQPGNPSGLQDNQVSQHSVSGNLPDDGPWRDA
jgi:hypothetical protein